MADPRTFVLIGNFTDNITPSLQKINESLAKVKANLESVSKATKPLKTDFRQLASLSDNFAKGLRTQASDIRDVTKAMRAMRNEMGRVNRAYKAGGRNIAQDARRFTTPPPPPPPPPRTPRYNYNEPPMPLGAPRGRGGRGNYGGGGGYAGGDGAGMAAGAFGVTLGNTLGNILTSSIVRGFQMGVGLMAMPFKAGANAVAERVRDELSDIQSAGGLFATDKRYGLKLFDDFLQARRTQEDINARLAASAAALPGATSEYVQQAKRITDTMIGALGKQPEAFVKYAETLGAKQGDKLDSLSIVIQKFTEKAVLLGKSPGGGPGGTGRSMYGIPQLLEILVNKQTANIQGMSMRYAAMRDNPLLASALQAAEGKINATAAGSAERLQIIMETLDQALPNEVVAAMKNSVGGFTEAIRSSFLDPEVGLFGLGRKIQLAVPRVNDLGQYIDQSGKVVESAALAAKDSASIFGLFRDVIGGFVVPLTELTQILPQIYDPLKAIGIDLMEFRNISQRFFATFNGFTKSFEKVEEELGGFKTGTAGARGALLTVANLLQNIGKINTKEFQDISKKLQKGDIDLGSVAKDIFGKLFDSKFMEMIGELIGKIVGDVLGIVAQIMSGASDMASAGPFASGLKKGFDAAKGSKSVQTIFEKLFDLIFKAISAIFSAAPLQVTLLAGLMTLGPAITAAIGTAIVGGLPSFFDKIWSIAGNALARTKKVVPVSVRDLGNTTPITDPSRLLAAGKPDAKMPKGFPAFGGKLRGFISLLTSYLDEASTILPNLWGKLKGFLSLLTSYFDDGISSAVTKGMSSFGNFFKTFGAYIKGVGPRFTDFFKGFLGKLSIFGAVITSVISLFQGKDLATSLAEGAGPLLGAALGAALIPFLGPIGPMIGAAIGGWVGGLDAVTAPLTEVFSSVGGALQGFGDSIAMIVTVTGDLFGEIGQLIGGIFGIKGEFDGLKIALAPFTLAFQALELGLKGFALLLAEMRVFFKRYFGSSEEYQGAIKERDRLNVSMKESQGRANAYNASMQGPAAVKKQINDAVYELQKDPKLTAARSAELKAFVAEARALLKGGAGAQPKPGAPAAAAPPKPGVPVTAQVPAANPAAVTAQTQAITATSTNTQQLNQKAATQITHAAGIKSAAVKTQTNTTTANTTLGNIRVGIIAVSNKLSSLQSAILGDLNNIQAGVSRISSLLASGALKVQTDFGMGGGPLGGGDGGPPVFGAAASKFGLQMTSGYRPGDPGYHGLNRARDYSNGSGPTPQMQMFAQFMASTFGSNLKELIYTPLGFSIKNGTKVPPYAQSTHMDHVHVAWAYGPNNPVAFGSMGAAQQWERSMVPGSLKVASVTANSGEGFGGSPVNVTNNISISQQPGQSADELAAIVAIKIGEAVADARAASIFV
jgi:hypothetical protein